MTDPVGPAGADTPGAAPTLPLGVYSTPTDMSTMSADDPADWYESYPGHGGSPQGPTAWWKFVLPVETPVWDNATEGPVPGEPPYVDVDGYFQYADGSSSRDVGLRVDTLGTVGDVDNYTQVTVFTEALDDSPNGPHYEGENINDDAGDIGGLVDAFEFIGIAGTYYLRVTVPYVETSSAIVQVRIGLAQQARTYSEPVDPGVIDLTFNGYTPVLGRAIIPGGSDGVETTGSVTDYEMNYGISRYQYSTRYYPGAWGLSGTAVWADGVEWRYFPQRFLGQESWDYPLPTGKPADMWATLMDGTRNIEGYTYEDDAWPGDWNYTTHGMPAVYPRGKWLYDISTSFGASAMRKDWGENLPGILGRDDNVECDMATTIAGQTVPGLFVLAADPEDSIYGDVGDLSWWTPGWSEWDGTTTIGTGVVYPDTFTGYEIVTPGEILSGELVLMTRSDAATNYMATDATSAPAHESTDQIMFGTVPTAIDPVSGLRADTFAEVSAAMELFAVIPVEAPGIAAGDWVYHSFPLPSLVPFDATETVVIAATPSVMPRTDPTWSTRSGWTPDAIAETHPWNARFAASAKAYPDRSVDYWHMHPDVAMAPQYRLQQPTIRWYTDAWATVPGELVLPAITGLLLNEGREFVQ